jgi:hypothetical protein
MRRSPAKSICQTTPHGRSHFALADPTVMIRLVLAAWYCVSVGLVRVRHLGRRRSTTCWQRRPVSYQTSLLACATAADPLAEQKNARVAGVFVAVFSSSSVSDIPLIKALACCARIGHQVLQPQPLLTFCKAQARGHQSAFFGSSERALGSSERVPSPRSGRQSAHQD